MKKSILLLISSLLGLSAVAIFYFFVNSFAIYLFFGIVLILLYFIATLYVEKEAAGDKEKIKNVGKILASVLFVPLFLGSVWVVKHTQQPSGQSPYFNTTDYHAIFNKGVAFNQKLVLYNASTNPNEQGLWPTESGKMQAVTTNSGVSLQFNRFFEPVFAQTSEGKFSPIHLIYSQAITSGFSIKNSKNTLDCKITPISEDSVRYSLTIASTDSEFLEDFGEKAPYQDVVELTDGVIKKGKSLYSIFIENPHFRSKKIKSKQILEGILLQIGTCYLLRNFKESEEAKLVFFPSKTLFDNQFRCNINGVAANPSFNTSVSLLSKQPFFVGFYNSAQKRYFDIPEAPISESKAMALYFDHPSGYVLSAQAKRPEVGTRQVRFLHNHYEQLLAQNLKEGFLFGNNYRKSAANFVAGNLFYTVDKPAVTPVIELTDVFSGNPHPQKVSSTFSLDSQDKSLLWLFQLKDFSENGFSFQRNLLLLSLLFLGFLFTILYNADYRFNRIEPIIYGVLYLFLTFRLVLLWRVATFPPLENSTKQELETLLRFDYSFFGLSLPLPLTFLLPMAFLIGLNVYRWKWKGNELATKLTTFRYKNYPVNWSITGLYALLLSVCLLVFLIAKSSPSLDILRRIFGIFIPIILYIVFTQKVIETSEYPIFKAKKGLSNWMNYAREWMHYWNETPSFYITLLTLGYFGWVDSGFGVLFLLFLILKNTLFSFLRKPHADTEVSLKDMFLQPRNYWVFGIFFLVVYLLFISYKPLFYQAFYHRTLVVVILLLLVSGYSFFTKHSRRNAILGVCGVLILLFIVPFTNQWLNGIIENKVKHVVHRAAIIFQPVDELITSKKYDSFSERRIIEAAENQWFINSYLSKTTDVHRAIDLQPHFNKGVGYTTQTRDVVVPRYIISEFGSFTLLCLLILLALPTLTYMLSFLFYDKNRSGVLSAKAYIGGVSLLLFFTIGFFVWLSSTNRFVFFGQDFPFLSLTSKLSLLLPLTLLFLPFFTKPQRRSIESISLGVNSTRYGIFILIVVVFVLASGRSNQLKESNFQISLEATERTINYELNAILEAIQKNTEIRTDDAQLLANQPVRMPKGLSKLLSTLVASDDFKQLLEKSDSYTRSVLEILEKNPSLAFRAESPIYIRFDDGRYEAQYNRHLYLELSPYSSENTWKGNVYQHGADSLANSVLRINQATYLVGQSPSFYGSASGTFNLAALPASWFRQQTDPLVLLNIRNQPAQKPASLQLIANTQQQPYQQSIGDFVNVLQGNELAHVLDGEQSLLVSLAKQTNWAFMTNYWVNGKQRMVYPLGEKLFWTYHYANAIRPTYTADSLLLTDVPVSLDYELSRTAQDLIDSICKIKYPKPNFKFGVIAADGDGNIRMISDFANNRKRIDPNNEQGIEALQRNYFFFSNSKNERDQWGNTNLLHLSLGPGSSIKPLVLSAVASQVNAGWEKLILKGIDPALVEIKDNESYVHEYAGFGFKKGWVIEPGDAASDFNTVRYLAKSSNFYHSLLLFLGSYTKEDFRGAAGYDIRTLLAFGKNKFPIVQVGEKTYSLPSYKDKWPRSSKSESTFFGNEKSVLAKGLANNLGLIVEDINKTDYTIKELDRVNYADSLLYNKYNRHQLSSFLWSFPEQSYFIQAERKHSNPLTNFNDGLKNPTLGGKPYSITPLKMAEMYGKLFSQNQAYHLHISHKNIPQTAWEVDSTWQNRYEDFVKTNVVEGMKQVLSGTEGTARGLFGGSYRYKEYYCYAKTGTINESTRTSNSKRFVLVISKNDIQQVGFKNNKFYVVYFTANQLGKEQDWALYRVVLDKITASNSFKNYMK